MLLQSLVTSAPLILLAVTFSSLLLVVLEKTQEYFKMRQLGKRPRSLASWFPWLGFDIIYASVQAAKNNESYEGWKKKTDAFGYTFEMTLLLQRMVFSVEPENVKAILTSQFYDFGKGELFHKMWYPFLGDSIFATDGEKWHNSRQLIRPQFIKDRVSDLHIFERHSQKMVSIIRNVGGRTIDIQDLFFRLTLDTATDFLLGQSVNSLESPQVGFAEAFANIQQIHNTMERLGPLHHFFPKGTYKKDLATLNGFVYPFVEKVIRMAPEELESKGGHNYNFLHALAGFTKDQKVLRDQIVAVLLAGRDTTAVTLSWALYELSRQPHYVQRLRQEILETVGPTDAPTYEHLKNMRFLQHVLNETLRLYPAVPFNIRTALKDTTFPRGGGPNGRDPVAIPKGTPVAYSAMIMQRRVDLFGPNANEFRPERWDGPAPKAWHYIPFNGGPRICIGQQFALTEMGYFLVRLFQTFEEVHYMDTEPQKARIEITISCAGGVNVQFREAGIV
ncbi:cytochrome P450 52A5 [Kalaharituber pfeilii]|nr:cytochrome P450 52A5 [Kalaharituber pfeilii]